jgi:hypothetical protein
VKNLTQLLTLLGVKAPSVLVVCVTSCDAASDDVAVTLTSPGGRQLQLLGDLDARPAMVGVGTVVRVRLVGETAIPPVPLFTTDRLENTFREQYPTEEWLNHRTLRFRSTARERERRVLVANRGQKEVRLFRLRGIDLVLILDLEPDASVEFDIPKGTDAFGVHAVFPDGTSLGPSVIGAGGTHSTRSLIVIGTDGIAAGQ